MCHSGSGACRNFSKHAKHPYSNIDYFLVSDSIADVFSNVSVCLDSQTSPHYSVAGEFSAHPRSKQIQVIQSPKLFPRHVPIGPRREPRPWPQLNWRDISDPLVRLNTVYTHYITNLELDLCDVYDLVDVGARKDYLGRANPPTFRKVSSGGT